MSKAMMVAIIVKLLDQASGPAGKIAAALRGIEKAGKRTDRALRGQASGVQKFGNSMAQSAAAVGALAFQQERLARSSKVATRTLERQRQRTGRRGFGGFGAGSSASGRAAGSARERGGSSVMVGGRGAIGAAVGVLAVGEAIKRTTGEAIDYEKAMAEVRKKVNDAPAEGFGELEASIKRTSKDLGIAQGEVASLTAEAGASGIAYKDLSRFIKLAAKAAVGWDMAPQEASQKLAEIKAGTGMTIGELEVLSDKINALGDNSAAKERNIVEMFHRSAAAAKEAGVSFDTSLATLTAVNSAGMQPEIASRWFNAFSGGLRTASDDSENMKEGLKILGLTAKGVSEGMKRDSGKTMLDVFDRLEKAPDAANAAMKIFGKGWWDETLRAKSAGAELRKQLELLKNPGNYVGSLDKGLNIQLGTTAKHLERLSALAQDVGERLGRWSLPVINDRIEKIMKHADDLDRRNKVREAGQGPQEKGDPMGRLVTKTLEVGGKVYDAALDRFVAPLPTDDPSRHAAAQGIEEDRDKRALAEKHRAEAAKYDEQAKRAGKTDKPALVAKAAKARTEAAQAEQEAYSARRAAGAAGARDMTDVEVGEAYAARSRQMRRRATEIEGTLGAGQRRLPNGLPGGGLGEGERASLQKELAAIRAELSSAKTETVKPAEPQPVSVPLPPDRPAALGGVKALGAEADAAKEKLTELGGVSVAPNVSTASIDAYIAKAQQALSLTKQLGIESAAASSRVGRAASMMERGKQTSMTSFPE